MSDHGVPPSEPDAPTMSMSPPSPPASAAVPPLAGGAPAAMPSAGPSIASWGWLALLALVALLLGLFLEEGGVRMWDQSEAWSVFAIVCAVVQLAPVARSSLSWTAERAWLVAAVGAGGLALYWLLLVLPAIARNTSFAITVATAAAIGGVLLAPGRHDPTR